VANTAQSAHSKDQETRSGAAPAVHGRAPILYVLSGDDALLLELGPLLGTRYRTRPIESTEQIAPSAATPWALMIDAAARTDARAQAARVRQQYPLAPLLVICADGTTAEWANPLARGALSAIVERSALGTEEFEAALSSVDKQLGAQDADSASGATPVAFWKRTPARLMIVIALVLATVLARTMLTSHKNERPANAKAATGAPAPIVSPAAQAPASVTVPTTAPRPVLELLSDARVAFREGKSLLPPTEGTPTGNSALELYAQVLAQDPQNEEARDGLRRLFVVASARIHTDLNAGKDEEAGRLLAAFHGVGIEPAAIKALEAEIIAARPRALAMQARTAIAKGETETATQLIAQLDAAGGDRASVTGLHDALDSQRMTTRLTELANHARALIRSGALLEPANDSAQAAVLSMQQLNRSSPLTLNTERELQTALIERTLAASRAGQYDVAQQLLNSAAILGNSAELSAARTQLQHQIEAPRTSAVAAIATAPAPAAAAAAGGAAPEFVRAKPLNPLEVDYPEAAFEAGQQGYVVVEFTLDAKGHASNARIVDSDPATIFDNAALLAVKRGRFVTTELGESGAPQRARIRIAFKSTGKQQVSKP
jgi:TonB family protein